MWLGPKWKQRLVVLGFFLVLLGVVAALRPGPLGHLIRPRRLPSVTTRPR